MKLRIGVNLGDVIEEGGSAFGDAVNVAARLQSLAKPGGVLISGPVYDQVHLKIPARFIDAGSRQVKNIVEPVRTFDVLPAEPAESWRTDCDTSLRASLPVACSRRGGSNCGHCDRCGARTLLARVACPDEWRAPGEAA